MHNCKCIGSSNPSFWNPVRLHRALKFNRHHYFRLAYMRGRSPLQGPPSCHPMYGKTLQAVLMVQGLRDKFSFKLMQDKDAIHDIWKCSV